MKPRHCGADCIEDEPEPPRSREQVDQALLSRARSASPAAEEEEEDLMFELEISVHSKLTSSSHFCC